MTQSAPQQVGMSLLLSGSRQNQFSTFFLHRYNARKLEHGAYIPDEVFRGRLNCKGVHTLVYSAWCSNLKWAR